MPFDATAFVYTLAPSDPEAKHFLLCFRDRAVQLFDEEHCWQLLMEWLEDGMTEYVHRMKLVGWDLREAMDDYRKLRSPWVHWRIEASRN